MKRTPLYLLFAILMAACSSSDNGELIGVQDRPQFEDMDPYGMVYIRQGSYTMGTSDENMFSDFSFEPKTVTLNSFWMDETEITNNEYRQFVYWVRDSMAHLILGENGEENHLIEEVDGVVLDQPRIVWSTKITWDKPETREYLNDLFLPTEEQYYGQRTIDVSKLNYAYTWQDLRAASKKEFNGQQVDPKYRGTSFSNRPAGMANFYRKEVINVYPDTLCWIHDFAASYNDAYTRNYFSHARYDHYPVVGVSWRQAQAFSHWRTQYMNGYLKSKGYSLMDDFRLPTEAEWEYAAKGENPEVPYPWGAQYVNNGRGCFLANFKPMRGNYSADGGVNPVIVAHYAPNDFGLFDMAGNVAEWCHDTYDKSSYNYTHDLNPYSTRQIKDDDAEVSKRKTIRGGSWKDQKFFIQTATRSYEYQDSGKSYVGFRNVQSYMGRNKGDNPKSASKVYH